MKIVNFTENEESTYKRAIDRLGIDESDMLFIHFAKYAIIRLEELVESGEETHSGRLYEELAKGIKSPITEIIIHTKDYYAE